MNIETVNELIASLESAGELSIKETKVMAMAKAYQQLAAENVALKAVFNKPDAWLSCHSIPPTYQEPDRGGEYLAVHEQPGVKNDDGSDSWPVYAKPEIETPATDRIVAGIKADGLPANIAEIIDSGDLETICYESERSYAEDFRLAFYNFRQLREGADK
ncbi:TPA: hypothetical protein ACNUZJ_005131 [Raoultella ornithinolytica]